MKRNIFDLDEPSERREEFFEDILRTENLLIERIVSTGQSTPEEEWYDQEKDEWVLLVTGSATLRFDDGRTVDLVAGDHLLIPARCRHRVERTSTEPPCYWVAVHAHLT